MIENEESLVEESLIEGEEDGLSFPRPSGDDIGWLLVGGGAIGSLVTLLKRQRDVTDWLIPLSFFGLGCAILLGRRQTRMEAAEESILAELDNLDPIARAQVLKAVAADELSRLPGVGSAD